MPRVRHAHLVNEPVVTRLGVAVLNEHGVVTNVPELGGPSALLEVADFLNADAFPPPSEIRQEEAVVVKVAQTEEEVKTAEEVLRKIDQEKASAQAEVERLLEEATKAGAVLAEARKSAVTVKKGTGKELQVLAAKRQAEKVAAEGPIPEPIPEPEAVVAEPVAGIPTETLEPDQETPKPAEEPTPPIPPS